jgi:hypothetical protein
VYILLFVIFFVRRSSALLRTSIISDKNTVEKMPLGTLSLWLYLGP